MKEILLNVKTKVQPNNIMYFEAHENYTIIHYSTNKIEVVPVTLKKVEIKLESNIFFRVHKSYLINLNFILKKDSRFEVLMSDNRSLTVARRKAGSFNKLLKKNNSFIMQLDCF